MVAGVASRRRDAGRGGSGVGRDVAVIVVAEVAVEGAFRKGLVDPEVEVAGGLQLVVTEEFFDDADGGAVHEEGCRERVADDVGRHLLGDTGAKRNVLGAVLDGLSRSANVLGLSRFPNPYYAEMFPFLPMPHRSSCTKQRSKTQGRTRSLWS